MLDVPYTTPEEDPFNVKPFLHPRKRRSSLLNKWIQEQQTQPTDGNPLSPLLDPHRVYSGIVHPPKDDAITLNSYDLIEDDDIPRDTHQIPSTPTNQRSSRRTSKLLHTPSSFRNFNIPFRTSSPSTPSDGGSPRPSRFSFLPLSPRHSDASTYSHHQHKRSSIVEENPYSTETACGVPSSKWRPSVLGHFSLSQTSVAPSDCAYTPSRPSMSSGDTTATTTENDLPITPSKTTFLDAIRSPNSHGNVFKSASAFASSSSLWSQRQVTVPSHSSSPTISMAGALSPTPIPTLSQKSIGSRLPLAPKSTTHLPNPNVSQGENDDSDSDDASNPDGQHKNQFPNGRPQVAYSSGGTLPRVKFATLGSRQRKKKKLVVSGVGFNDTRKFEGVKRWCESFGEVSQILRMPNGDLHVHFRLVEVADTVCRLRAKVYIAGVGSVQLSWFAGDKR